MKRFNLTLKEKMWRYFTFKGKYVYYDVLDKIIHSYNNSYHRTIKLKPVEVSESNEEEILERVFTDKNQFIKRFKFSLDDKVRISKYKTVFAKGYTPNWSEEIFIVSELVAREPNVYKIRDLEGERVEGIFYESELQKVLNEDNVFKVESIIKTRTRNKQKEVLVKWLGYPDNFNSWEQASSLVKS